MKTQQRSFVVEIKSTRRRSKTAPKSIWGDTDFKALVREAEASHLISHDNLAEVLRGDEHPASGLERQEKPESVDVGEDQSVQAAVIEDDQPISHEVEVALQKRMDLPKQTVRRKLNRRRDIRPEHVSDAARDASTTLSIDSGRASLDELTALEAENRRLKLLLAKQLRQQNAQLREMLERFAIA